MPNPKSSLIWALVFTFCLLSSCSNETPSSSENAPAPVWEAEPYIAANSEPFPVAEARSIPRPLQPGDRFPLRKIVVEELIQPTFSGPTTQIAARHEQDLTISVTDRIGERTKLAVAIDRVQFSQRVGEETVTYDSLSPRELVAEEITPFDLFANDGFSFWVDAENRIVAVDSFQEFLARHEQSNLSSEIQTVSFETDMAPQTQQLAAAIWRMTGMQPLPPAVQAGDQWQRSEELRRPVPLVLHNRYTVTSADAKSIVLEIQGEISPSAVPIVTDDESEVVVSVTGGQTVGRCTLAVNSGIPEQVQIEHTIDMQVRLAETVSFSQIKKITTTIQMIEPPAIPSGNGHPPQSNVSPSSGTR